MTYKDKAQSIGKKGIIDVGRLKIEVEVQDYKHSYGHDRWLVSPLSGSGEIWVEKVDTI